MKLQFTAILMAAGSLLPAFAGEPISDKNLESLVHGNWRFVKSQESHPHADKARREEVAKGQKPFAVIVTCADSRLSPELLFDQGLGDLFVVRVAGNVVDSAGLASVEYAVEHLGAKLVVVMGHERCGAVTAALPVKGEAHGHGSHDSHKPEGHIPGLVQMIKPAVKASLPMKGDLLENSIKTNVRFMLKKVQDDPMLKPLVKKGEVNLRGAYYDLDSGVVSWFAN